MQKSDYGMYKYKVNMVVSKVLCKFVRTFGRPPLQQHDKIGPSAHISGVTSKHYFWKTHALIDIGYTCGPLLLEDGPVFLAKLVQGTSFPKGQLLL